jgi:hypothetical protein
MINGHLLLYVSVKIKSVFYFIRAVERGYYVQNIRNPDLRSKQTGVPPLSFIVSISTAVKQRNINTHGSDLKSINVKREHVRKNTRSEVHTTKKMSTLILWVVKFLDLFRRNMLPPLHLWPSTVAGTKQYVSPTWAVCGRDENRRTDYEVGIGKAS